jgi:hypothetical protein
MFRRARRLTPAGGREGGGGTQLEAQMPLNRPASHCISTAPPVQGRQAVWHSAKQAGAARLKEQQEAGQEGQAGSGEGLKLTSGAHGAVVAARGDHDLGLNDVGVLHSTHSRAGRVGCQDTKH